MSRTFVQGSSLTLEDQMSPTSRNARPPLVAIATLSLAALVLAASAARAASPTDPVTVDIPMDILGEMFVPAGQTVDELPNDYVIEEFLISGAAPPKHFVDGYRGARSERQPPMYFPLGGGTHRALIRGRAPRRRR